MIGTGSVSGEGQEVLQSGADLHDLVRQLQRLCDLGVVCDFTFRDATTASAFLIGISSTALIVDRWDSDRHRPAGDPYVMPLEAIDRMVVP